MEFVNGTVSAATSHSKDYDFSAYLSWREAIIHDTHKEVESTLMSQLVTDTPILLIRDTFQSAICKTTNFTFEDSKQVSKHYFTLDLFRHY